MELPGGPIVVRVDAVDDAYVSGQTGGTRLITTDRAYLEGEWSALIRRTGRRGS